VTVSLTGVNRFIAVYICLAWKNQRMERKETIPGTIIFCTFWFFSIHKEVSYYCIYSDSLVY